MSSITVKQLMKQLVAAVVEEKVQEADWQDLAMDLDIRKEEVWTDFLGQVQEMEALKEDKEELTMKSLEENYAEEYGVLLEELTGSVNLLVSSLRKDQIQQMRLSLKCLTKERLTQSSNGSSNMATTTMPYTTVPTPMDAAGASTNLSGLNALEELYQRKDSVKKTLNYSSSITLKLGEKPNVYTSENRSTPDYFVDLKIYDLNKIAPENLGTQNMWKDAIVRTKFYGRKLTDFEIYQTVENAAVKMVKMVQQRQEDELNEDDAQSQAEYQRPRKSRKRARRTSRSD